MLKFKNIFFTDNNTQILKNISLHIDKGDCISIVGPSGSGKSTLLKLCSHLISPNSGDILFKDKNYLEYKPTELRKYISYCIQTPILFGETVFDNLVFPFTIRKKQFDSAEVIKLLEEFNLDSSYLDKSITSLSGGEKQRISIIRNILFTPEVLLLDEATSALDYENALIIQDYIKNLNKSGVTVLWITHSIEQSTSIFNKRIILNQGEIEKLEDLT